MRTSLRWRQCLLRLKPQEPISVFSIPCGPRSYSQATGVSRSNGRKSTFGDFEASLRRGLMIPFCGFTSLRMPIGRRIELVRYLIREVIGDDTRNTSDTFFRILLFKLFNRIETWELLEANFDDLNARSFDVERYDRVLGDAFASGERLYSAAYIMPSGGRNGFPRKHRTHLQLLKEMLRAEAPQRISEARTMAEAFPLLRAWPTLGDFLAYQFVTDLNYSRITRFEESEFVMPGPGAGGGLQKCFAEMGGLSGADAIRLVTERQNECLRALGLRFATLWGRPLQLIDCQNLFCEVNKYARVVHPEFSEQAGRTRIKQKLRPTGPLPPPKFPAKWGLNERLREKPAYAPTS